MDKMACVSRHTPTTRQLELAYEAGYELVHIGDCDAFSVTPTYVRGFGNFAAVAVAHPAAALRLIEAFDISVFETADLAPAGQPPRFDAVKLHIFCRK